MTSAEQSLHVWRRYGAPFAESCVKATDSATHGIRRQVYVGRSVRSVSGSVAVIHIRGAVGPHGRCGRRAGPTPRPPRAGACLRSARCAPSSSSPRSCGSGTCGRPSTRPVSSPGTASPGGMAYHPAKLRSTIQLYLRSPRLREQARHHSAHCHVFPAVNVVRSPRVRELTSTCSLRSLRDRRSTCSFASATSASARCSRLTSTCGARTGCCRARNRTGCRRGSRPCSWRCTCR